MFLPMTTLMVLLAFLHHAKSLVAYDCGGTGLNVTTISLLDIGECNLPGRQANETDVYVQLLQLSTFEHTPVMHCKIEVERIIYHCGMHSHASVVHNGHNEYLHDIGYSACKRLHNDGTLSFGTHLYLMGFKVNTTSTRPVTFAGNIETDGTCEGTTYSDPYGTWNKVVVQGIIRVTLRTSVARVKLQLGKIILNSGTSCRLRDNFCLDDDLGHSFWESTPAQPCDFKRYDLLYEGPASKHTDIVDTASPTVYSLTTQEITFALARTGEDSLCGYTLHRTEHPRLFILETTKGKGITKTKPTPADNLDIFTYVNSKFVYVERHIRGQINNLYQDVLQQRCRLERQILKNALSTAKSAPEEFAHILMKGPGYVTVIAGEVAHLLKCVPVAVQVRHVETCYNELPVLKGNQTLFASPKTRILTKSGTERDCNNFLPVMYNIEGTWHRMAPTPMESLPPQVLQPLSAPTWKYLTPETLARSGIYSEEDLDRLRDHIMFPAEKAAVLNTIARGANGQPIASGSLTMYNLLDEESINKITDSAASRLWSGFITFGSASAGVLAVFIIIRLIKLIFDTMIRGYALHSVYGCSLYVLGAIWSSVAHLLLHLAARPKTTTNAENKENTNEKLIEEKQHVITIQPGAPPALPRQQPAAIPQNAPLPPTHYNPYEELRDRIARIDQNLAR